MLIFRALKDILSRWGSSRAGNVAVISGLTMSCLVGFCGLGADVGYWYYRQRVIQGAADVTAYNAAVALSAGTSQSTITSTASSDAATNGWKSGQGTITVNMPPQSGTHINSSSVEVILTEKESRYFSQIFSSSTVNESVRAVATYRNAGIACLLALDKTAKNALNFWGNNTTKLINCNAMSNSLNNNSLGVGGSANVTVPCAMAAGGVDASGTLNLTWCKSTISNAEPAQDPYANVPAPTIPKSCTNAPKTGDLSPGRYCGGLTIQDTRTLDSGPGGTTGIYVIDGGTFKLDANANISGSNIMIYLTNGATLQFNGNAQFNLSADTNTSDTYHGLLFYSDRTQGSASQTVNGTANSMLTGALYFPTQQATINGDFSGKNGCMQVVADTITFSGNSTLNSNCPGTGLSGVPVPGNASLVE